MELSKRPALDADTDFARSVHHQAYRDVVVRQFGVWDEEAQDEFFKNDWAPAAFEIILCDGIPCGYMCVEDRGRAWCFHFQRRLRRKTPRRVKLQPRKRG